MKWSLPKTFEISGEAHPINADYRDILNIITKLSDENVDGQIRVYVSLALFYKNFFEIDESSYREAVEKMVDFISCGEKRDGRKQPKQIDWEQDYSMIVSGINKVAGYDIREEKFLHWWSFISMFSEIGEGPLLTVVSIREKLRKGKKLEKWEKEFYHKNRDKVDFKTHYSQKENEVISAWLGVK